MSETTLTEAHHAAVERALEAMRAGLGDAELRPAAIIVRATTLSRNHFGRIFKQVTGLPLAQFFRGLRLEEARRLLASTNLSITEVGRQVGYYDAAAFSAFFRKTYGISPTQYRKQSNKPE